MKTSRIELVEILPEQADFMRRRVAGILNSCVARETSLQLIAMSCYRQGLEDALQVCELLTPEEHGYGHGV